jgi:hypothetical protein
MLQCNVPFGVSTHSSTVLAICKISLVITNAFKFLFPKKNGYQSYKVPASGWTITSVIAMWVAYHNDSDAGSCSMSKGWLPLLIFACERQKKHSLYYSSPAGCSFQYTTTVLIGQQEPKTSFSQQVILSVPATIVIMPYHFFHHHTLFLLLGMPATLVALVVRAYT